MDAWQDYPMSEAVNWPRDEKVIGVLGLAPLATVDFYQKLCALKVRKDWQYPRILIDSNPKIPSRGRFLELGETDPVPFIQKGIANLSAQGADIVAVPCNTAHILYAQYAKDSPVFLPNIIEITAAACRREQAKKILILASRLTIHHELYQKALSKNDVTCVSPDTDGQGLVSDAIEEVKQNHIQRETREALHKLIEKSQADTVILACTELPVILNTPPRGIRLIDSSMELARYCLKYAMKTAATPD